MSVDQKESIEQAHIHVQNGELEKAISLYEKVISTHSSDTVRWLSDLGVLYHQNGQFKKAVEIYGRSLQAYPEDPTTLLLRGITLLELKRHQAALKDFNETIRLSPYLDNAYWGRGQVFIALEDYSWAIASFTKAIDLNPDEADYYRSRAEGLKALGRMAEARADLAKWEEKRPFS